MRFVCSLCCVAFFLSATAAVGQYPVIAPAENLVVDGIPAIPAELAEKYVGIQNREPHRLWNGIDAWGVMLISTRFGNTPQLHLVRMPGGARCQLTFFAGPVGGASWEPTKGDYFVFSRDTGGNEFGQLYRYDVSSGSVTLLTDGGRSQNGGIRWNHAKDKFLYSTTRRNGADRDLWIMDPLHPERANPLPKLSGGGWAGLDGLRMARKSWPWKRSPSTRPIFGMINVNTGEKNTLTDLNAQVAYGGAEFSRDGKGLYMTSDKDNEFQRLAYLNLASGDVSYLTSDIAWDVEEFEQSPDGSTIVFLTNEAGISLGRSMDTKLSSVPIQGLPAGVIGGASWHDNGQDIAFTVNSAKSTSDVYSLNVPTGEVSRWTESELGGLLADELVEPELIRWKSFDELEITGFLYPAAKKFEGGVR